MSAEPGGIDVLGGAQFAAGRCAAYELLADLWTFGLTAAIRPQAEALEVLASVASALDDDQAAAAYQRVLGFNVFPHSGVFLTPDATVGGGPADAFAYYAASLGAVIPPTGPGADHVGVQLDVLAFLCGAEADALAAGDVDAGRELRDHQRALLSDHLLPWLPLFLQAVVEEEDILFSTVAGLTATLIDDHVADVGCEVPGTGPACPPVPGLLDQPETGLREIADYLLTPAQSGLYISRDAIGRLGRDQRLPRGFGARRQLLHNLLVAAASFDGLGPVMEELSAVSERTREALETQPEAFAAPWLARLAATERILAGVAAKAPA